MPHTWNVQLAWSFGSIPPMLRPGGWRLSGRSVWILSSYLTPCQSVKQLKIRVFAINCVTNNTVCRHLVVRARTTTCSLPRFGEDKRSLQNGHWYWKAITKRRFWLRRQASPAWPQLSYLRLFQILISGCLTVQSPPPPRLPCCTNNSLGAESNFQQLWGFIILLPILQTH